jgi:hypothetical protein
MHEEYEKQQQHLLGILTGEKAAPQGVPEQNFQNSQRSNRSTALPEQQNSQQNSPWNPHQNSHQHPLNPDLQGFLGRKTNEQKRFEQGEEEEQHEKKRTGSPIGSPSMRGSTGSPGAPNSGWRARVSRGEVQAPWGLEKEHKIHQHVFDDAGKEGDASEQVFSDKGNREEPVDLLATKFAKLRNRFYENF